MRATARIPMAVVLLLMGAACSSPLPGGPPPAPAARAQAPLLASGTGAARTGQATALLTDGRVLLAGGLVGGTATASAEIFDPARGTFTGAGPLNEARVHATATVLPDGRVLVVGGDDGNGASLESAELFDPRAGSAATPGLFSLQTGALAAARTFHTATRLPSGHVLVAGGRADASTVLDTVEEYTYVPGGTGSWADRGSLLLAARARHTATLLADGRILLAGGEDGAGAPLDPGTVTAAERLDPGAGTSAAAAGLGSPRALHTATLLRTGNVLLAGGWDGAAGIVSTRLYRPGSNDLAAGPDLDSARYGHAAALLPDGNVVITGGTGAQTSVEVHDPAGNLAGAGAMATGRSGHAATVLPSGRVLLTGGGSGAAEVLDAVHDAWTTLIPTGYLPRSGHTATLLVNGPSAGLVLVVGGVDQNGAYYSSAQLYDPVQNRFVGSTQSIGTARAYHTATVLPSGDVLVAGGRNGTSTALATAKLFRAATGTWVNTAASMAGARAHHTATLLKTGRVLIAGGENEGGALPGAELYDPAADGFSGAGAMSAARTRHGAASLPDGKVLLVGGAGAPALSSADLFDPATGLFGPAGGMATGRAEATATALPDGRVLVAGGTDGTSDLGTAELFDPASTSFSAAAGSFAPRRAHAAAALPSGEVILSGGHTGPDASDTKLAGVERFEPASGTFVPVTSLPLAGGSLGRDTFTATLLPSGRLLAYGGDDNTRAGADPLVYDACTPVAATPPDLAGAMPLQSRIPGALITYAPAGAASFTGGTEAASGNTGSSAVDHPIFVLERQGGDGIAYARTTRFAPGSAQVRLPDELAGGWWWIRAIVAGVPGKALPFYVLDPFRITPLDPTVPPRGSLTFAASGGSGTGYAWSLTQSASASPETPAKPAIDPATGAYTAGGTPDSIDIVQVEDSLHNTVTTQVHVGPGVSILGIPAAPPRGHIAFSAEGGVGPPYAWSFLPGGNRSGATLDAASGAYTAGALGGVFDDIRAVDALGNHAEVSVEVTTPVVIGPAHGATTPLGTLHFTVSGGYQDGGYTWTVSTNASGGSVDTHGTYQAGRTGRVTDTVRVTDSLGSFAEVLVDVSPGVSIAPAAPATPPRGSLAFTASGGTDTGFAWSLATNASGGSIDAATGAYTAGATPSVTDVVQVQDSLGNLATVPVAVGPGITITPAEPGAYPGQTVALHAQGGSGAGFTWIAYQVTSNGGRIDAATGVYTAGTTRGTTDLVRVTDSLGNEATVDVVVWPDWQPGGSGCSSLSGGTGALGLALLALWLALRGRPRRGRRSHGGVPPPSSGRAAGAYPLLRGALRRARRLAAARGCPAGEGLRPSPQLRWGPPPCIALSAALLLAAGVARAQTPAPPATASFVAERFQPAAGAYDVLGVQSAQVPGHMEKTFRAYGNYASRPLVLSAPDVDKVALLKSQTAADLGFSLGLLDWAEVSAVISGVVSQGREQHRFLPPNLRQDVASSGFSDVRLVPRARILEWRKLRLGVAAPVGLPTGNKKAYLGQGGPTFGPEALIELDALGPARLLLNAGAVFRQERKLADLTVGNAYTYGAGMEYPFRAGAQRLAALATFAGEAGMKGGGANARPMELLGALRWTSPKGFLVSLGGGPGIGKGYGTPQYRVFAELGFGTAGSDRLQEKEPPVQVARAVPQKPEEPKAEPAPPAPEPVAKAEPPAPEPAKEPPVVAKYEPLPEPKVGPDGKLRIDTRVFFDFNKKAIKEEYKPLLLAVARKIADEPRMHLVQIEGHADELGPPEYNLWLSEERARAVKDFLLKAGVPPSRVKILGFGKNKPASPGRTRADHAKNRRVEFSVEEQ